MARTILTALLSFALTSAALAVQPPTPAQEGFIPLSELPPGEQLPAGPFLVGSYAFFLVLMMFYLWTIWRRITRVEAEMKALERRTQGAPPR